MRLHWFLDTFLQVLQDAGHPKESMKVQRVISYKRMLGSFALCASLDPWNQDPYLVPKQGEAEIHTI